MEQCRQCLHVPGYIVYEILTPTSVWILIANELLLIVIINLKAKQNNQS